MLVKHTNIYLLHLIKLCNKQCVSYLEFFPDGLVFSSVLKVGHLSCASGSFGFEISRFKFRPGVFFPFRDKFDVINNKYAI